MMDYELFKEVFTDMSMDFLPTMFGNCEPHVEKVTKVNRTKDALTVQNRNPECNVAVPIIYLDDMYERFQESEDMDELLADAATIIVNFTGKFKDEKKLADFSAYKDRIVPNIINAHRNRELLANVPHRDFLDLAVVYRIMVESPIGGFDTLLITHNVMKELGLSEDELHETAMKNISHVLPLHISRIVADDLSCVPEDLPDCVTFVSTEQMMYGAAYMLHEETMDMLTEQIGSDKLYILPLSINEFGVTKDNEAVLRMVKRMLRDSNKAIDYNREFLSKKVYSYDGSSKAFSYA